MARSCRQNERTRSEFKFEQVRLQERDLKEGIGVNGKAILEWNLNKQLSIRGIGLIGVSVGLIGESL